MARPVGDVGLVASPFVWIGIALMLTTLWGANALSKSRKARATPGQVLADETASDALDPARRARDIAESDARAVLAREMAQGPARSEAEVDAREALARELAQRETDREAQMRARLEQARAEQEAAARELAEIEAARASRQVRSEPIRQTADQVRDARVRQAAAAEAGRLERDAMDRAARDARLAAMPSNLTRDLAAAVLGLPGSERFWGNVIIAQARVEGVVKSGSALRIDGMIDGACQAPVLMISQGAVITGTVAAETIVVLGTVRGTLIGRNVTIAETAQVEGDMFYQTMSLDQNAQCDVRFSRLPKDAEPSALGEVVHQARNSKAA